MHSILAGRLVLSIRGAVGAGTTGLTRSEVAAMEVEFYLPGTPNKQEDKLLVLG